MGESSTLNQLQAIDLKENFQQMNNYNVFLMKTFSYIISNLIINLFKFNEIIKKKHTISQSEYKLAMALYFKYTAQALLNQYSSHHLQLTNPPNH